MRYIISLVLTSLCLTGPQLAAQPARAEAPLVVADIPPVHALVAQVLGDLGTPALLLPDGASEHDLQLRPSQAQALQTAGLVVWIGPELTPALDRALGGLTPQARLALLDAPETQRRPYSADGAHDHAADHADTHADTHGETDPHAWLDPANARLWLGLIAARLSQIDPANAATYGTNAAAAQTRLDALDARIAANLSAAKAHPLVVAHDGYGYFAARYGLTILGSVALGDATAPGAAKLSALQDSLATGAPACLFPEALHDPAPILQLAQATGLPTGTPLDPVGSTLAPGPDAYEALLSALSAAIAACVKLL